MVFSYNSIILFVNREYIINQFCALWAPDAYPPPLLLDKFAYQVVFVVVVIVVFVIVAVVAVVFVVFVAVVVVVLNVDVATTLKK